MTERPSRPAALQTLGTALPSWQQEGDRSPAKRRPLGYPSSFLSPVARRWWRILARDWPHLDRRDRLALRHLVELRAGRLAAEAKMAEAEATWVKKRGEWMESGLARAIGRMRAEELKLVQALGGTPLARAAMGSRPLDD